MLEICVEAGQPLEVWQTLLVRKKALNLPDSLSFCSQQITCAQLAGLWQSQAGGSWSWSATLLVNCSHSMWSDVMICPMCTTDASRRCSAVTGTLARVCLGNLLLPMSCVDLCFPLVPLSHLACRSDGKKEDFNSSDAFCGWVNVCISHNVICPRTVIFEWDFCHPPKSTARKWIYFFYALASPSVFQPNWPLLPFFPTGFCLLFPAVIGSVLSGLHRFTSTRLGLCPFHHLLRDENSVLWGLGLFFSLFSLLIKLLLCFKWQLWTIVLTTQNGGKTPQMFRQSCSVFKVK